MNDALITLATDQQATMEEVPYDMHLKSSKFRTWYLPEGLFVNDVIV